MNEEDEAFEELAMKQGHWQHTSGWRKKQIMDKIEQAFPNPHRTDMGGMSLRDYFAAKAMQGLIASPRLPLPAAHGASDVTDVMVADLSYKMADAMLKARDA